MHFLHTVHTDCTRRLRYIGFNSPFLLPLCGDWLEGMQSSDSQVVEGLISPPSCKLRPFFLGQKLPSSQIAVTEPHTVQAPPLKSINWCYMQLIHSWLHLFSCLYCQLSVPRTQLHSLLISMSLNSFWKPLASILLKPKPAKPTAASLPLS